MKIRNGFVSNSSSTSFCIYGTWINSPEENLYEIAEDLGLFVLSDQYGDGLYIGRGWDRIGDEETGKQFKKVAQDLVNKLPIEEENKKCSTIQEGWYDG